MASPPTIEEQLWAWLRCCPLDRTFYGQLILTVRAGQVDELEQRQTHRRPRQKGGQSPPEDRSRQSTPHS
jgi:hypothetical protein